MEMETLNVTTYEETSSSDYELERRAQHTPQVDVIHEYEEMGSSTNYPQHTPPMTQHDRKNTRSTDKSKIVLGIIIGGIAIIAGLIAYILSEMNVKMQKMTEDNKKLELQITNITLEMHRIKNDYNSYVSENEDIIANLQNTIKENARHLAETKHEISLKVAVTACAKYGTYKDNVPIPFPYVKTLYGITNLSTLTTNGLFTCESDGLYIVSVTIVSKQKYGRFYINKNNNNLVKVYLQNKETEYLYSGSNTAVVLMSVKDTISVKPRYGNPYVFGNYFSCITVVKVK